MKTIYIIKFTNPTSPAPTYKSGYFTDRKSLEEYLESINYVYDLPNKYHFKTDNRYCAHVLEFYN